MGSHTIGTVTKCMSFQQANACWTGRHNWFAPSTQGMHAAHRRTISGWFTSMTYLASFANRGRAKGLCRHAACGSTRSRFGIFGVPRNPERSAPNDKARPPQPVCRIASAISCRGAQLQSRSRRYCPPELGDHKAQLFGGKCEEGHAVAGLPDCHPSCTHATLTGINANAHALACTSARAHTGVCASRAQTHTHTLPPPPAQK